MAAEAAWDLVLEAAEGAAAQAAAQVGAAVRVAAEVCGKPANPARRRAVAQVEAELVQVALAGDAEMAVVAVDLGAEEAELAGTPEPVAADLVVGLE